ncbi:hypothetical protein GPJ56_001101 [Histomonas meleagridis]|uniref:uncharacterized protein n=1 Tax=Histomonas meleagridis TaxID=135588 RepID=UPI00355AB74A|nr:hypothetical protein GPJ56_001101 [Histomonas meleagridis]KAH0798461.1 hypothetical protein GO595_008731 [Histomonas meleagridis]
MKTNVRNEALLKTITDLGKFQSKTFHPARREKSIIQDDTEQLALTAETLRTLQAKNSHLKKSVNSIEKEISYLQEMIDRHKNYINQVIEEHNKHVSSLKQQIKNRREQIEKINDTKEPPTMNQIYALIRQIQVEGMAAKRRAESAMKMQDVNSVLSGERLRRFHDYLQPKPTDKILQVDPKVRKSYIRMEENVFKVSELQTQLKSLRIFNKNLERKIIELNSNYENLQSNEAAVQKEIANKKEELRNEITMRSEEMGKLEWKIECFEITKENLNLQHNTVLY